MSIDVQGKSDLRYRMNLYQTPRPDAQFHLLSHLIAIASGISPRNIKLSSRVRWHSDNEICNYFDTLSFETKIH
jgi:hypothetical protein